MKKFIFLASLFTVFSGAFAEHREAQKPVEFTDTLLDRKKPNDSAGDTNKDLSYDGKKIEEIGSIFLERTKTKRSEGTPSKSTTGSSLKTTAADTQTPFGSLPSEQTNRPEAAPSNTTTQAPKQNEPDPNSPIAEGQVNRGYQYFDQNGNPISADQARVLANQNEKFKVKKDPQGPEMEINGAAQYRKENC